MPGNGKEQRRERNNKHNYPLLLPEKQNLLPKKQSLLPLKQNLTPAKQTLLPSH